MSPPSVITLAVLFPFILAGCVSEVVMNKHSQSLGTNEAIVLTKIRASAGTLTFSAEGLGAGRKVRLADGDNFLALRLTEGQTYKISRYDARAFGQHVFRCENPLEFTPTTEAMIYIGDISMLAQFSSNEIAGMLPIVTDNERETIDKLKQKYASLFQKYRYRKMLVRTSPEIAGRQDAAQSNTSEPTPPTLFCRQFRLEALSDR